MREKPLSSKIVLILAGQSDITFSLNDCLKKEVSKVIRASIPHEAMVQAILAEPDFILIEVTPSDISGLQFPEMLRQIKGMKTPPVYFIYADKKTQSIFQRKIEPVYFLDQEKIPALIAMMKTGSTPAPELQPVQPVDRSVHPAYRSIADRSFRVSESATGSPEKAKIKASPSVYAAQGVQKREREESPVMPGIARRESKELDVLEKLGQLGIIKKT